MKKKGFTLVELLAVIALLSILVIIVLPNIMSLFNRAKQNSFENEIIQIFKQARQQWATDSLTNTGNMVYARSNVACTKELDLSGRTNVNYYVEVDKYGNVIKLFATDNTYQYEYRGDGLKLGAIGESQQVANLQSKDVLTVTCDGASKNGRDVTNGAPVEGSNIAEDCSGNEVANTIPSNATGLYKIMADASYLDNAKSPNVTRCEGVDFNAISSDTNGKGVYEVASTKDDAYPIYYYRGAVTNNNVKFGGFCWKAVRTTNTGGVKLVYNGSPNASGHCTNTTGESTQIKKSSFNENNNSPAYVGYMYGTTNGSFDGRTYSVTTAELSSLIAGYKFGKGVTYNAGAYVLTDTTMLYSSNYSEALSINKHYTCLSASDTCETVYYVYYMDDLKYYYVSIAGLNPNGSELIDVVKNSMFRNDRDSTAKIEIENWYKNNMTSYTSKLEDTVYCSDRSVTQDGAWNPTGGMIATLLFNGWKRTFSTHTPSLACERPIDRFTVSSSLGNGKLKYPVGLLTTDEIMLAGARGAISNSTYYLYTNQNYWASSPVDISQDNFFEISVSSEGSIQGSNISDSIGLRPVVSISKNTSVSSGDGTTNNPYIIS